MSVSPATLQRIAALIARTDSPFEEEARTSALLAIKLLRVNGLIPDDLLRLAALWKKSLSRDEFARQGARARTAKLTAERRSEIARIAAHARWSKRSLA